MELSQILKSAVEKQASDIFIVSGLPLSFKVNHVIEPQSEEKLFPDATEALIREIYSLANERDIDRFLDCGDDDFSFRFREYPVFVSVPINSAARLPLSSVL